MSISFSWKKLPVDSNGKAHDSLEAFQATEIKKLIEPVTIEVCNAIVSQKDAIMEILELTLDARPSARGVRKPRKPKQVMLLEKVPA